MSLTLADIQAQINAIVSAPYRANVPVSASNLTPGAQPSPSHEQVYYLFSLAASFKSQGFFDRPHEWYVDEGGFLGINVIEQFAKPLDHFTIGFRSDGSGVDITP